MPAKCNSASRCLLFKKCNLALAEKTLEVLRQKSCTFGNQGASTEKSTLNILSTWRASYLQDAHGLRTICSILSIRHFSLSAGVRFFSFVWNFSLPSAVETRFIQMCVRVAASQFALVLNCWQYSPLQITWGAMYSEELRNRTYSGVC